MWDHIFKCWEKWPILQRTYEIKHRWSSSADSHRQHDSERGEAHVLVLMQLYVKRQGEATDQRGETLECGATELVIYLWCLLTLWWFVKKMLRFQSRTENWLFIKALLLKLLSQATDGSLVSNETHVNLNRIKVSIQVVRENRAAEKILRAFAGNIKGNPVPADFCCRKIGLFGKRIICPFYHFICLVKMMGL